MGDCTSAGSSAAQGSKTTQQVSRMGTASAGSREFDTDPRRHEINVKVPHARGRRGMVAGQWRRSVRTAGCTWTERRPLYERCAWRGRTARGA